MTSSSCSNRRGLVLLASCMVFLGCLFVSIAEAQNKTEFFVFQSHTQDFWQVNGDDAGTQAGELGFIWHEWDAYPQYHYVTMYQIIANDSWNEYVPCEEGDTCSNRYAQYPKHMGMSDMGFVAIPSDSYNDYYDALAAAAASDEERSYIIQKKRQMIYAAEQESVQYYDFTWYSLPRGGICPPGEPLGTNNCGYYAPCAVKTVARSCVASKPGWHHYMNRNYYGLWAIMQLAFQETDPSVGGCPDVTYGNYTVCKNAEDVLRNPESFGKIPDPRKPLTDSGVSTTNKQKRSIPLKEEAVKGTADAFNSELSSPLLGLNLHSNSLCRIMGNESDPISLCKPLLYFDPPLDRYSPKVMMSSSTPNGLIFIHLRSRPSAAMGCEPARVIGYHYDTNSVVYNFTLDYNLEWFDIDMNDGYLVGLLSEDGTVFRMQVVTVSLKTLQTTIITPTPIYNNSRQLESIISYDPVSNTIYFSGIQGYLNYPVFLSYTIPSFTEVVVVDQQSSNFNYAPRKLYSPLNSATTVFPIILLNYSGIYTLTHSSDGNLYSIVDNADDGSAIAGVMNPATALIENDITPANGVALIQGQSSFDPISNELVFCISVGVRNLYALASYNVATGEWYTDEVVHYDCKVLPFRFVYSK